MSDKGEKICPLCTEEMDLTDQHLKPCKCGYEICVWCWHHIMDMAEKNETEGRCPACRTPYDKEKIVGMAANCERFVAEVNLERKQKLQKAKPKPSEGRKHLSNVRVIQRNLVYIIGLPLSLADEDLLQHMEYFGQYGKVLKVSISRTASGVIQHSSNNCCCVYITYSKEEEAVRCIQSVHNFILEGRPLRACFGTTKYCHAWLRNMPCTIPDCLYLHDFGSQEDSFIKDEIVSAFTRSRVQQIVGATNNLQRRSGNVLPPPMDVYSNANISSTTKPAVKSPSNNTGSQVRGSCPDDSTGRSSSFPVSTSWVMRVSTSQPLVASLSGSSGPVKQKPDTFDSPIVLPSEVASTKRSNHDVGNRSTIAEESCEVHPEGKLDPLELTEQYIGTDCQTAVLKMNADVILDSTPPGIITSGNHSPCLPASKDSGRDEAPHITSSIDFTKQPCSPGPDKEGIFDVDGEVQSLCSGLSSVGIHSHLENSYFIPSAPNSSISNPVLIKPLENQGLQQDNSKQFMKPTTSLTLREVAFDNQRMKGLEGICHPPSTSCSPDLLQASNQSSCCSLQQSEVCTRNNPNAEPRIVHLKHDEAAFPCASAKSVLSNGFNDDKTSSFAELGGIFGYSNLFSDVGKGTYMGRFDNDVVNAENNVASDMGESNIISNIMSMDLDAWDDPLSLPHSLVKLLSETDGQHGSLKIPSLRKVQSSNQSRFSFARQEDFENQHVPSKYSARHGFMENKNPCVDECQNMFSPSSFAGPDNFPDSHSFTSSNQLCAARAHISTPPGFSVPRREPPPGFSLHGAYQAVNHSSVNHLLQTSLSLEGQFQTPSAGNVGSTGDVEFFDPAILEVGKGMLTTGLNNTGLDMRATLCPQLSPFEHEARLQLLMHQSIAAHQNVKFSDNFRKRFSPPNDSYGIPPMLVDQSQVSNPSPFTQLNSQQFRNAHTSNGHWNGWNEIKHTSDLGISELLTNERLGFSNFISGYDDLKFRMPGSGNLYNRGFGM